MGHNAAYPGGRIVPGKRAFRKLNGDQKAQKFSDFVDKLSQSNIEANSLKVGLQARKANNNMDQGISGSK